MVDRIYEIKNKLIKRIESDIQRTGIDRIDVKQMGELVDMVKDLAAAEESCMEAEYYKTVTQAMSGSSGYGSSRMGYGSDYRAGYSDKLAPIKQMMQEADPAERDRMASELRSILGMM